jgi:hypothetical protein
MENKNLFEIEEQTSQQEIQPTFAQEPRFENLDDGSRIKFSEMLASLESLIKMHGTEEDLVFIRTFRASVPKKYENFGTKALAYIVRVFNNRTFLASITLPQYMILVPRTVLDFVRAMHNELLINWLPKDKQGFISDDAQANLIISETRDIIYSGYLIIVLLFSRILYGKDRELKIKEIEANRFPLESKILK